ncbi:tetratricopeptide repeat protein [Persicimonas caeni]|uniref:Tetratricopeptide repeat protein n=1 Tax=Persicimonas caeni TaxID=2292766 RepID=A0A4Y6PPJ5_PERCE|nr:tetratricopeptide repeat protein [Persicimonas caeni]QDG49917.1 tetratricopeptide repeat protein [Persicimonas caeni]QED31138.1 tetratricopeptide repeat protein [Persicimonas caeni]
MADQQNQLLSSDKFLALANRAGLTLSEADLAQLTRRNLVRAHEVSETREKLFHPLHLYLLVRYFEAVRPVRHPWTTVAPELTLQDIAERARQYRDVVSKLVAEEPVHCDALVDEIRDYAQSLDPFGPLASVVGQLRAEALTSLRGDGALYVQLIELVEHLSDASVPEDTDESVDVSDDSDADDAPEEAVDVAEAVELADDPAVTQQMVLEEESEAFEPEPIEESEAFEPELIEESEAFEPEPIEESEPAFEPEPIEEPEPGAEDENAGRNPFTRESSEVTTRTKDLQSRLDRLRSHDKEVARKRGQTPDEPVDSVGADEAEVSDDSADDLHSRIGELNRLREQYLAEQRWEDLADLYEEGIELFVDPVERQQVFLTLAMVYELKLKRLSPAFDRFVAAYLEEGTQAGKEKAFEGLQRLGRQPAIEQRYVEFLEEQLAGGELGQLPDEIFEPMAVRAARHHADLGEVGLAMEYYERVLDRLPEHEVAFHSLAQLYEDAGRMARLLELYETKVARLGKDAPTSLRSELARVENMVGAASAVD